MTELEIGKAVEVRRGERVAILNFGTLLPSVMQAAKQLNATVVDMRWVKPLDETIVMAMAYSHELLVTVEENAISGGAGSEINELLAARGSANAILNLGLPDIFQEHGSQAEQRREAELDADSICAAVTARLGDLRPVKGEIPYSVAPMS
jgi:1-deoxy-D-xylulose-5-phosphate synthase